MAKRFKMTYSKRRIIEGFNTLPFGFCSKWQRLIHLSSINLLSNRILTGSWKLI
jgi:hypothetical protein